MSYQQFLRPQMTEAVLHLGHALTSAEPFVRFQRAKLAMNEDAPARGLLNNLSLAQARVRKAQGSGTVSAEDLQNLGDLQRQVEANAIIMEYNTSQQEMIRFFQEINAEISQLLGINFALIARRSSCC